MTRVVSVRRPRRRLDRVPGVDGSRQWSTCRSTPVYDPVNGRAPQARPRDTGRTGRAAAIARGFLALAAAVVANCAVPRDPWPGGRDIARLIEAGGFAGLALLALVLFLLTIARLR